jgi:predicted Zn-dependent protease
MLQRSVIGWLFLLVSMAPVRLEAQPSMQNSYPGQSTAAAGDAQMFQQAQDAMQRGDFATARPLLVRLHARMPDSFAVNELLGLLYASQNNLTRALPPLEAAAKEQPDSDIARANLGATLLKLHRAPEAAHELQAAVRLNPRDPVSQENLGQAEMLLHRPAEAARAFGAALPLDPGNADLAYNDALALFDSGNYTLARETLSHMPGVELSASAQSLYGDIDEKLARYKQAAQHDLNAARLDPSESNIYVLGVELLRHWTFAPAIREFAAGVKRYPDSRRMRLGLGVAYYGNGNYDQAIPVLADLLAEDPDNPVYADLLGRTCTVLTEGNDPRCSTLVPFAEKHPQNATLATYAATSILHRPSNPQNLQTAQTLLQHAIAAAPQLAEAHMEMGVLLQTESKWAQSVAPLETAVRLKPDLAQAHYRLARAYAHLGQHERAEQQIALDQQYSKSQQQTLNARMQAITTLVVNMQ